MADNDTDRARSRSNYGTGYIRLNCGHYTTPEEQRAAPRMLGEYRRHRGQSWCSKCLGWRKEMQDHNHKAADSDIPPY